MINRRSVPALHRACLHLHHQPETGKSGREFACKPIENGHDSVQRLKEKVGDILVPGNKGKWSDVRETLNRVLRGWCGYFSPGSHYVTDKAIEAHVYDRVPGSFDTRFTLLNQG